MVILLAGSGTAGSISQLITVFILFILVLAITVYATKFVGNYQKVQGINRNLEVIETLRITNNKYLQIVRAADKYFVIGIGKDEVSMLTEIDGDEILKASTEKGSIKDSFGDIFAKAGLKTKTNGDKNDNNE